ncbi:MAG TPA: hypothetical protein VK886_01785 [Vicinamibacterales bacterium]|nr:hypothetical protein [Vicinamibacterales bacterium]
MQRFVACVFVCLAAASAQAQERPLPDASAFLREARNRLEAVSDPEAEYVYVQTRRERKLDKAGRTTSESVTVVESYPGLPGESRWERVIEKNGVPPSARELDKADRERKKHVEEYERKLAGDPAKERARQAREHERRRRRYLAAVDEIFSVFDTRMLGREAVRGHDTIVFSLTPRPEAKPRTRQGKIMRKVAGRVWISESDHELVRLEAESLDTISIGLGLLARVHKGSSVSLERRKVGDVWLPALGTYSVRARVGLVSVLRRAGTEEFSDYRRFNVETSATYAPPKPPSP